MVYRILASVLLLFSILFMPLWVSAILALGGMVYFNIFWEAVPLFLLSDLLYGVKEIKFNNIIFISFIASIIILIIIEIIKKKLKFYPSRA
ncbi:MAG: hypothetical protein WC671_00415 [Candidatus Paceibacterota bacterium]|jgi:hypothetical protein